MLLSLRPNAIAGVVLAGAGLIAVTPVAPPLPDVQTLAVQLTQASAFPLITPDELVTDTSANLQGLATEIAANPTPILSQILTDLTGYEQDFSTAFQTAGPEFTTFLQGLPGALTTAFDTLSMGQPFEAWQGVLTYLFDGLLGSGVPILETLSQVGTEIGTNLDNVVTTLTQPLGPLAELLLGAHYGPVEALNAGTAVAENIINALGSGDFATVLTNLEDAPSTITGAFLNGYPDGFLSPLGYLTSGFGGIQNILNAEQSIAEALGAPAPAAAVQDPLSGLAADLTSLLSGSGLSDLSGLSADLLNLF
jgi:hypothetical protein